MTFNRTVLTSTSGLNFSAPSLITSTPVLPVTSDTTIISSTGGTVVGALLLTISFLLGVPGNLFVIWSIVARTRRHSVTTLLILNLACADGSLMVLTPFFIVYLIKRGWIFGLAMCKVLYYLCCANMYASIFLITLMSVHRLVAVVWPQRFGTVTSQRNIVRVIVVLWILAVGLSVPVLAFREITRMPNKATDLFIQVCDCKHSSAKYAVMQYGMETLLGFLLPFSLILVSYLCILRRIRQTRFQRRIRTEKLILAIVVTFAALWLPYHTVNMFQVAEELNPGNQKIRRIRTLLRPIASALAFISSCMNPILYVLAGKSYIRRAGVAFMARLFEATGRDSSSRKNNKSSQNSQVRQEGEEERLRRKESESTTSAHSNMRMQNGS